MLCPEDKICIEDPASYCSCVSYDKMRPFPHGVLEASATFSHHVYAASGCPYILFSCLNPVSRKLMFFQKAAWPSAQLAKTAVLGINKAVNSFSNGLSTEIIYFLSVVYCFSGVLKGPLVFPSCLMLVTVSWQAMPHALQRSSSVWIDLLSFSKS